MKKSILRSSAICRSILVEMNPGHPIRMMKRLLKKAGSKKKFNPKLNFRHGGDSPLVGGLDATDELLPVGSKHEVIQVPRNAREKKWAVTHEGTHYIHDDLAKERELEGKTGLWQRDYPQFRHDQIANQITSEERANKKFQNLRKKKILKLARKSQKSYADDAKEYGRVMDDHGRKDLGNNLRKLAGDSMKGLESSSAICRGILREGAGIIYLRKLQQKKKNESSSRKTAEEENNNYKGDYPTYEE